MRGINLAHFPGPSQVKLNAVYLGVRAAIWSCDDAVRFRRLSAENNTRSSLVIIYAYTFKLTPMKSNRMTRSFESTFSVFGLQLLAIGSYHARLLATHGFGSDVANNIV